MSIKMKSKKNWEERGQTHNPSSFRGEACAMKKLVERDFNLFRNILGGVVGKKNIYFYYLKNQKWKF